MKNELFRIFVSSTYIDLIDYRKAAEKAKWIFCADGSGHYYTVKSES